MLCPQWHRRRKTRVLQSVAGTDFLIAQSFPIPERFHTTIHNGELSDKVPMATYHGIRATIPFFALFEDVLLEMEKQIPKQTKFRIGQ